MLSQINKILRNSFQNTNIDWIKESFESERNVHNCRLFHVFKKLPVLLARRFEFDMPVLNTAKLGCNELYGTINICSL